MAQGDGIEAKIKCSISMASLDVAYWFLMEIEILDLFLLLKISLFLFIRKFHHRFFSSCSSRNIEKFQFSHFLARDICMALRRDGVKPHQWEVFNSNLICFDMLYHIKFSMSSPPRTTTQFHKINRIEPISIHLNSNLKFIREFICALSLPYSLFAAVREDNENVKCQRLRVFANVLIFIDETQREMMSMIFFLGFIHDSINWLLLARFALFSYAKKNKSWSMLPTVTK